MVCTPPWLATKPKAIAVYHEGMLRVFRDVVCLDAQGAPMSAPIRHTTARLADLLFI